MLELERFPRFSDTIAAPATPWLTGYFLFRSLEHFCFAFISGSFFHPVTYSKLAERFPATTNQGMTTREKGGLRTCSRNSRKVASQLENLSELPFHRLDHRKRVIRKKGNEFPKVVRVNEETLKTIVFEKGIAFSFPMKREEISKVKRKVPWKHLSEEVQWYSKLFLRATSNFSCSIRFRKREEKLLEADSVSLSTNIKKKKILIKPDGWSTGSWAVFAISRISFSFSWRETFPPEALLRFYWRTRFANVCGLN